MPADRTGSQCSFDQTQSNALSAFVLAKMLIVIYWSNDTLMAMKLQAGSGLASMALLALLLSCPTTAEVPWRTAAPLAFRVSSLVAEGKAGVELSGTNAVPLLTADLLRSLTNGYPLAPGDEIRTPRPSITLLKQQRAILNLGARSVLSVLGPEDAPELRLEAGRLWFESRGQVHTVAVHTPHGVAYFTGTKFQLEVEPTADGSTRLLLLDGAAVLETGDERVDVSSGEEGRLRLGETPRKSRLRAQNRDIRWVLYYPGVLNLDDLNWPGSGPPSELRASVTAYETGDLLAALEQYPRGRAPSSATERVFRAAVLLAVGAVDDAEEMLAIASEAGSSQPSSEGADLSPRAALRLVMNTVQGLAPDRRRPTTASGWLAESYYQQAQTASWKPREEWELATYRGAGERDNIARALSAAQQAISAAPDFGFALVRVAELQFSQGRNREARALLEDALERLCPRHAQGWALRGFMAAAIGRKDEARESFSQAIELDPGLANGWLGRGLVGFSERQAGAALDDLQVAAVQEPDSANVRSYLGKAYYEAGEPARAITELTLAAEADPHDPTPWLYLALVRQQANEINAALADLEQSITLNDNRAVFRSRLLLEQDRAVRSANLASIYRDAGMSDVSIREAGRAVTADYANHSAHLFLANSYDALRDPRQITLRYEAPWLNEWLLAQLLQPVGAGTLSQTVSQQEYSRLFESRQLGVFSRTDYTSNGDWLQSASQYGTLGRTAYAVDTFYRSFNGERHNDDFESLTLWGTVKQELTAQDSVLFQVGYYQLDAGDTRQLYDPAAAIKTVRVDEQQAPTVLAGYHRQWNPHHHTLVLAGWINGSLETAATKDAHLTQGLLFRDANGLAMDEFPPISFQRDLAYDSDQQLFTVEGQHIWQTDSFTTIVGTRYQHEQFDTSSQVSQPSGIPFWPPVVFNDLLSDQTVTSTLERFSAYGYEYWRVAPGWLTLVGGVAYDHLDYPVNHRSSPITEEEDSADKVSPKAGFIATPFKSTSVRASYTQSLGGVSYDQSYRLEPTQVAGLVQTYRSLIPESVYGSLAVPDFELASALVEHRLPTRTYMAVGAEWLASDARQVTGAFESRFGQPVTATSVTTELEYQEGGFTATVNQLIGECLSLGVRYRLSRTTVSQQSNTPELFAGELAATLHAIDGLAVLNLPSGVFSEFVVHWRHQENDGYSPDLDGDEVTQLSLYAGYRFARRRCEARVGIVNITNQDYRLNPLSFYSELPRERMLYASLKLQF